jgi:hypothetical protein
VEKRRKEENQKSSWRAGKRIGLRCDICMEQKIDHTSHNFRRSPPSITMARRWLDHPKLRTLSLYIFFQLSVTMIDSFALHARVNSFRATSIALHLSSISNDESIADDNHVKIASLMQLFQPSLDVKVDQMSSTDLAYIGDAVYELLVRSKIVWPSKKTSNLQTTVVGLVRGE